MEENCSTCKKKVKGHTRCKKCRRLTHIQPFKVEDKIPPYSTSLAIGKYCIGCANEELT